MNMEGDVYMDLNIKRSDTCINYKMFAQNNKGYISIDTSDWIDKPWMFYELPSLKFEIFTEVDNKLVKYKDFEKEVRTYNQTNISLNTMTTVVSIENIPNLFILRITPLFNSDSIIARNMLIENGIETGDIWGENQEIPTQEFILDIDFIDCEQVFKRS